MFYVTTRVRSDTFGPMDVLNQDRGPEGGYFVPRNLPRIPAVELRALAKKRFSENVADVINLLFDTRLDGWGIEFEIPASFIQLYFPAFEMSEARANFYKCGDKTEVPHYLAWSDLTSERPDYHRAGDFGDLYFK